MKHKNISTETLLSKIRQEAATVKKDSAHTPNALSMFSKDEPKLMQYVRKIHRRFNRLYLYHSAFNTALQMKRCIFRHDAIDVYDFLQYNDAVFIKNAYRILLQRDPDENGFHWWLSKLRTGQSNKIEILSSLRYSGEGQEKKVKIKGLYSRYVLNKLYKVPVAGYLIKLITSLYRLPFMDRSLELNETFINALHSQISDKADVVSVGRLQQLSERTEARLGELSERTEARLGELSERTEARLGELSERMHEMANDLSWRIKNNKASIIEQQRRFVQFLDESIRKLPETWPSGQRDSFLKEKEHIFDDLYLRFEDRYRGTEAEIRQKLSIYLQYIEHMPFDKDAISILDLGCGRGEWLQLLKERGYKAKGVEINRVAVQECLVRGLEVFEADALQYLRERSSDTIDAITGFHIIEHLPFDELIAIFDEALRVLKDGGIIIFETPNPTNILVSAYDFFRDPTHARPLHPDTLSFIAQDRGFANAAAYFLSIDDGVSKLIESTQWRLDTIEDYLKVSRDFAVIAYKPTFSKWGKG